MILKSVYRLAALAAFASFCAFLPARTNAQPEPDRVMLTGWVSCSTCFELNACKAQTRLACIESRVSAGASYVLVVGAKHYVLSGSEKDFAKAAAENSVTVIGELDGNQLLVASIDFGSKKRRQE